MNEKNEKKKASRNTLKNSLPGIIVVAILTELVSMQDFMDETLFLVIIGFIIIFGLCVFAMVKFPKHGRSAEEHSHDRLHPVTEEPCTDALTHYKKQLDSFLANGIIDRNEYRTLLEKYAREIDE